MSLTASSRCFLFFFKQKTAYEVTEGDWSSDVCSSDLERVLARVVDLPARQRPPPRARGRSEERRVGKSVLSCVDLGGRRIIKKKNKEAQVSWRYVVDFVIVSIICNID